MEEIITKRGNITVLNDLSVQVSDGSSFLDIIFSSSSDTIVFSKINFSDSFYDLKSGVAGEIAQKVSNYRIRMIILGDFSNISSKSFQDFVYECNHTGKMIFSENLEDAIELLK